MNHRFGLQSDVLAKTFFASLNTAMNGPYRGKKWSLDKDEVDELSQGVPIQLPDIVQDVQQPDIDMNRNEGFIRMSVSGMKRPMLLPFSSVRTAEQLVSALSEIPVIVQHITQALQVQPNRIIPKINELIRSGEWDLVDEARDSAILLHHWDKVVRSGVSYRLSFSSQETSNSEHGVSASNSAKTSSSWQERSSKVTSALSQIEIANPLYRNWRERADSSHELNTPVHEKRYHGSESKESSSTIKTPPTFKHLTSVRRAPYEAFYDQLKNQKGCLELLKDMPSKPSRANKIYQPLDPISKTRSPQRSKPTSVFNDPSNRDSSVDVASFSHEAAARKLPSVIITALSNISLPSPYPPVDEKSMRKCSFSPATPLWKALRTLSGGGNAKYRLYHIDLKDDENNGEKIMEKGAAIYGRGELTLEHLGFVDNGEQHMVYLVPS